MAPTWVGQLVATLLHRVPTIVPLVLRTHLGVISRKATTMLASMQVTIYLLLITIHYLNYLFF